MYSIYEGECLEVLRSLPDNSIDSLVTDPPAGISFMGLVFDHHKGGRDEWVKWLCEILEECRRVMKPGAIGFVWSLPRTQHWTALACEDAGFEIWDNLGIAHVQGGGFPKGQGLDALIDKRAGVEREVVGKAHRSNAPGVVTGKVDWVRDEIYNITAPATQEAQQWHGWRTKSLKPALEFWIAIQKPFPGSCVDNVLEWGVGGINIADNLIGDGSDRHSGGGVGKEMPSKVYGGGLAKVLERPIGGRYPANFGMVHSEECGDECVDECPCKILKEQGGVRKSGEKKPGKTKKTNVCYNTRTLLTHVNYYPACETTVDSYFHKFDPPVIHYQSKASPKNRSEGVDMKWKRDKASSIGWTPCSDEEYEKLSIKERAVGNIHATTKSTGLMEHLCKLATPPGGTVLDPFMGSGTTGVAAIQNGFKFIGIEREPLYIKIAKARLAYTKPKEPENQQMELGF